MRKTINVLKIDKRFVLILMLACFSTFFMLGTIPGGVNQDEAYAGYEAYSLLHYGTDSYGYVNPVYFVSWGSGMNTLYSYLSIPLLAGFRGNEIGFSNVIGNLKKLLVELCKDEFTAYDMARGSYIPRVY